MAKGYRICKVCGEQYEYCYTDVPAGVNRWQDVACCPEHAAIYFEKVAKARGEYVEPVKKKKPAKAAVKAVAPAEPTEDAKEGEQE